MMGNRGRDMFVFGVGRSGTTMLYSLVQMIADWFDRERFRASYEAFLFNTYTFDDFYENVRGSVGETSSLLIGGIFHHLGLPMFIEKAHAHELTDHPFLRRFSLNARSSLLKLSS